MSGAPLGVMGGKIALGDAAGVTELTKTAIFAHGKVPLTRGARLWKIGELSRPIRRKRATTVEGRSSAPIVNRLQGDFCRAVADGFNTWVLFTLMFDQALGARVDDFEADFIRQRSLAIIRKKTMRLGADHCLFWAMERDRKRGIHIHALAHVSDENNALMRGLIQQGFGSACETEITAPAFKFHTRTNSVAGPVAAGGWWNYCLAGLVLPGHEIAGVRGKAGCLPLQVKQAGVSRVRCHA